MDYYIDRIKDIYLNPVRAVSAKLNRLKLLLGSPISKGINDLETKIERIFALMEHLILLCENNSTDSLKKVSLEIVSIMDSIFVEYNSLLHDENIAYNTDSYYKSIIKTLNEKINDFQEEISSLEELNKKLSRADEDKIIIQKEIDELQKKLEFSGGVNRELEKQNKVLLNQLNRLNNIIEHYNEEKEKLIALQNENDRINEIVKKYEIELEKNRQRDDAINNWKIKISDAFKGLEEPINRLVEEHKRLEWLYNVYKWSSAALVIFLIIIEIVVYIKIVCSDAYPTWDQYLPMALPVPITLGLLWGFIT